MKKLNFKYLFIAIVILLIPFIYYKYFTYSNVKFKCRYMAYACGDCFPQYKVDTIYLDSKMILKIGDDVNLKYFKNGSYLEISEEKDSCWICYDYYIVGKMRNSFFNNRSVEVESYSFELRKNCCK